MAEFVHSRREGRVGIVSIARAERRNALNLQVKQEIVEQVLAFAADAEVAVIVLTGEGGYFVAGTDIAEMASMRPTDHVRLETDRVFHVLRQASKPVIAAVEGYALGGGCMLALAQDLRVASDRARFGLPEVTLGFNPAYGIARLLDVVGGGVARELLLTARVLRAQDALRVGLINRVVAAATLRA